MKKILAIFFISKLSAICGARRLEINASLQRHIFFHIECILQPFVFKACSNTQKKNNASSTGRPAGGGIIGEKGAGNPGFYFHKSVDIVKSLD